LDSSSGGAIGIVFALGESLRDGDGALEFSALLVDCGVISRNARFPSSPDEVLRTIFDELIMVVKSGLEVVSLISVGAREFDPIGTRSGVPRGVTVDAEMDNGGGFRFLFMGLYESSEESVDVLRLLSRRSARGRLDRGVRDLDSVLDGPLDDPSPRCNFASTILSVTCRLREFLIVLPSLLALLLFTLILPSIILAGGGGCSIHRVSSLLEGCVLTTGGCKSLTGGFRDGR
jgi:hypothetical protein